MRVVFLDAPTGSGKTLIAELTRRTLIPWEQGVPLVDEQGIYVCTTKSLQSQFAGDFDYAEVLKGRANYPTVDNPDRFPDITAADCTLSKATEYPACGMCPPLDSAGGGSMWGSMDRVSMEEGFRHCDECHPVDSCPYLVARDAADRAPLAVLNTAYLLTALNGPGMFRDRGLVVIDEADELETELMRHVTVTISARLRDKHGIDLPAQVGNMEAWKEWLWHEVRPKLQAERSSLSARDRQARRRRKYLAELLGKIDAIVDELDEEWVVDGYEDARKKRGTVKRQTVEFKPVHVRDHAPGYLWSHAERFLLMSATIISPAQMAYDLGLDEGEWETVTVPSTFPPERRPIFIDDHVGPVTNKTKHESWPALVDRVQSICDNYPDERVLVHTHSYALTNYLRENFNLHRNIYRYSGSNERDWALVKWLEDPKGVMLAPSFERGVDLFDDRCRVQVIAKVPYPYLGDKQVSKRMRAPGGQTWYTVQTIRSIVQMTGRVVRSKDDWGATHIVDGSIWRLLRENGGLFPKWWRDAVVRGLDSESTAIREGFQRVREGGDGEM